MSYFQARLAEVQIPPKKPQKYLFHVPRTEKSLKVYALRPFLSDLNDLQKRVLMVYPLLFRHPPHIHLAVAVAFQRNFHTDVHQCFAGHTAAILADIEGIGD